MKKLFTLFTLFTAFTMFQVQNKVSAQTLGCKSNLTAFSRTFEYLSSGTEVTDIESDCASKTGIPLGFNFKFGPCGSQSTHNTVQVSSNGWINLGAAVSGCQPVAGSGVAPQTIFPGLWPFYGQSAQVSGAYGGVATYSTDVLSSGNKVFTMEWKNWRITANSSTSGVGYYVISFQVKLYEGSNLIEYCYKIESTSSGSGPVNLYLVGMGKQKPSSYTSPYPATPCPGYDYFMMNNPISTPTINRGGSWGAAQAGLPNDNQVLQFYQACCGKPAAGVISQPDSVCACQPFVAKLSGATPNPFTTYGVHYQWQTASSSSGPWSDITGGTATSQYFAGICASADTFVRVIVTCDSSGLSDTTPVKHITLITQPYNCYCYSAASIDDNLSGVNIGNVKIINKGNDTLLNNGSGTPGYLNKQFFHSYTLNTGVRPIPALNRDSVYKYSVMGITRDTFAFAGSGVATYIDWNKDGVYNTSTELANFNIISGTSAQFISSISVPSWAMKDTLGMRVVMKKGAATASDVPPCGAYTEGETEDYLVVVQDPICPGPLYAGKAYITDTSMCDGYTTTVWDTAHARSMSQMHWEWEYSLDNTNWANVTPSSRMKDTITPVVRQNTYYRLRIVCEATRDTIYSNKLFIKRKEPYKCYCHSIANGTGGADSSDIGTFKIGTYTFNTGGAHVRNPEAIRLRTDRTDLTPMDLWADTKYDIAVYHTLVTPTHGDARISVFIDYNHNLIYDVPAELVWTATSTYANFYPHDTIRIPAAVIPNVATGLRVVLNNNMGGSNPNDFGCDEFTSGEIEDYLVILHRRTTGIADVTNVDNLQIYPNPNNGQFTVSFNAPNAIADVSVSVTSITGQQIMLEQYQSIGSSFNHSYDLSGKVAGGVYFITLTTDGQKSVQKLIIK
ncbi:GEVED domain-containing protein [Rurimicrobium arvi]|uniref:Secretion system C-terminal sorting domain-containing protein n=1 Tax=Rurimicrobium arvi TaxID=2049916 RepID=A0ABP8MJA3_9BACT